MSKRENLGYSCFYWPVPELRHFKRYYDERRALLLEKQIQEYQYPLKITSFVTSETDSLTFDMLRNPVGLSKGEGNIFPIQFILIDEELMDTQSRWNIGIESW